MTEVTMLRLWKSVVWIARQMTVPQCHATQLVCGVCERWESCGRPPNENCVIAAWQIDRKERQSDWSS
jgi:hypothetical protein